MIAIVGLGNIGNEYNLTYHNMGFMALDAFAKSHNMEFNKNKFDGKISEGVINGEKVILLKPSTFMNLSGHSVAKLVNMYKLDIDKLLVVYDDIDLPYGNIRLRAKGSAGTHRGMKNIIELLGTQDFARLRLGIEKDKNIDLADYVLSKISKERQLKLDAIFEKAIFVMNSFIENKGDITKIIV